MYVLYSYQQTQTFGPPLAKLVLKTTRQKKKLSPSPDLEDYKKLKNSGPPRGP